MKPALFVTISCAVLSLSAASPGQPDFSRTEAFIPMRDGVKLYTEIYAPKDSPESVSLSLSSDPGQYDARPAACGTRVAPDPRPDELPRRLT